MSAVTTEASVDDSGESDKSTAFILVAIQKPAQFRWEVTGDGASLYTGKAGEQTLISDGENVFWYLPGPKLYSKHPIGDPITTPMRTVPAFIDKIESDLFGGFKIFGPVGAVLLADETIASNGSLVPCYVVRITTELKTAFTWWVDKENSLVLRVVFELLRADRPPSLTRTTEFSYSQIGGLIDKQVFVFSPPAGVRQVE